MALGMTTVDILLIFKDRSRPADGLQKFLLYTRN